MPRHVVLTENWEQAGAHCAGISHDAHWHVLAGAVAQAADVPYLYAQLDVHVLPTRRQRVPLVGQSDAW